MKKSNFITTITLSLLMLLSISVSAQDFPDVDKSPMDVASFPSDYKDANKLIKIQYSRPMLKNRPLSKLAPNGEVWRTGANEAAELTLYTDMKFGDTTIKKGIYTFSTIPGEKEWTAIINKDLNVWGSYFYKEDQDVARIKVPATTVEKSLEAFSLYFSKSENGIDMHLGWDKTRVVVPFKSM